MKAASPKRRAGHMRKRPSTTLPLYIFSKVRLGVTPDMNALATIIVGLVGTGVAIAGWFMYRAEKKR
jgi:putrescine transport system permease protein